MAEWTGCKQTGLWYIRVAAVLREFGHMGQAIEQIESALKLDDKYWLSWSALGWYHFESQNFEKAISSMDKARELLQDEPVQSANRKYLGEVLRSIGDWSMRMNMVDAALQKYRQAFDIISWDQALAMKILRILEREKRHREIVDLFEQFHAELVPGAGISRLTELLYNLLPAEGFSLLFMMIRAGFEADRLDFVQQSLETAVSAAWKSQQATLASGLQQWLGMFILRARWDDGKATQIWERLMAVTSTSRIGSELGRVRSFTANELSMIYLEKALAVGKDTSECERYCQKLEALSMHPSHKESNPHFYGNFMSTRDTTLVLGSLYRALGKEEAARACFLAHLKIAIGFLTDDDSKNDTQGFWKAADVCVRAGQDDHAAAAYSVLGKTAGAGT